MTNDRYEEEVAFVVETLQEGGASVLPYNSATRDRAKAAVRRAEEIIGMPIEVVDIHDEQYGMLRLRVESLIRMPDSVVRAYEEAHKSEDI